MTWWGKGTRLGKETPTAWDRLSERAGLKPAEVGWGEVGACVFSWQASVLLQPGTWASPDCMWVRAQRDFSLATEGGGQRERAGR